MNVLRSKSGLYWGEGLICHSGRYVLTDLNTVVSINRLISSQFNLYHIFQQIGSFDFLSAMLQKGTIFNILTGRRIKLTAAIYIQLSTSVRFCGNYI